MFSDHYHSQQESLGLLYTENNPRRFFFSGKFNRDWESFIPSFPDRASVVIQEIEYGSSLTEIFLKSGLNMTRKWSLAKMFSVSCITKSVVLESLASLSAD